MTTDLPVFPLDHLPLFGEATAPALIIRERVYNYEELNLRIGRLASWLSAHEFTPGDRVATWLGKGEIACLTPLAAVRAGLVHVPINPLLKAAQVAHIMADSGALVLITNAGRAAGLSPSPSGVEGPVPRTGPRGSTGLGWGMSAELPLSGQAPPLTPPRKGRGIKSPPSYGKTVDLLRVPERCRTSCCLCTALPMPALPMALHHGIYCRWKR